jgi:hypothetical protein
MQQRKIAYFSALRTAAPELTNIATRRQARPPELDRLAEAFSLAGEKQEMVADQRTRALLERSVGNSEVEKARTEFERAQKVEEQFHRNSMDRTSLFLFANDLFCLFVGSQSEKHRLPQLVVARPLGKRRTGVAAAEAWLVRVASETPSLPGS